MDERLKAKMLLDHERPKVNPKDLRAVLEGCGFKVTTGRADLGVVVGGDGLFGEFGRTETAPLLFVKVKPARSSGSKAYLAAAYYEDLPTVLNRIAAGDYTVTEHKRLEVLRNGHSLGEVFTDAYLQRGAESNCLRYNLKVADGSTIIEEAVVGDGVIVTTATGSTGYYSYPDRIKKNRFDASANTRLDGLKVGICHVNPTYIERSGSTESFVRYTVPWGSRVELSLFRPADARLYGVGRGRGGLRVKFRDRIEIMPGRKVTKTVSFPD